MSTPSSVKTPYVRLPDTAAPPDPTKTGMPKAGSTGTLQSAPPTERRLPTSGGSSGGVSGAWSKLRSAVSGTGPRVADLKTPLLAGQRRPGVDTSDVETSDVEAPDKVTVPKPRPFHGSPVESYYGSTIGRNFIVVVPGSSGPPASFICKTLGLSKGQFTEDGKKASSGKTEKTLLEFESSNAEVMRAEMGLPPESGPTTNRITGELAELTTKGHWFIEATRDEVVWAGRPVDGFILRADDSAMLGHFHVPDPADQDRVEFGINDLEKDGEALTKAGFTPVEDGIPHENRHSGRWSDLAQLGTPYVKSPGGDGDDALRALTHDQFIDRVRDSKGEKHTYSIQVGNWPSEEVHCSLGTRTGTFTKAPGLALRARASDPLIVMEPRGKESPDLSTHLTDELRSAGFVQDGDGRAWVGLASRLPSRVTVHEQV